MYCSIYCPQQAIINPYLHWRFLDTLGQVWVSLLCSRCSFLLGPGARKVLFVPSKSLFLQSCVNSSSSMVGLLATSPKWAYAIPRSDAPKTHALQQSTDDPNLCRRHSNSSVSVSVGSLGSGAHKVCLSPLSISGRHGV